MREARRADTEGRSTIIQVCCHARGLCVPFHYVTDMNFDYWCSAFRIPYHVVECHPNQMKTLSSSFFPTRSICTSDGLRMPSRWHLTLNMLKDLRTFYSAGHLHKMYSCALKTTPTALRFSCEANTSHLESCCLMRTHI